MSFKFERKYIANINKALNLNFLKHKIYNFLQL